MRKAIAALVAVAVVFLPSVAQAKTDSSTTTNPITIGAVQGNGQRSPLAPATGESTRKHQVRGVVTQLTLDGDGRYGFFLQSRNGTDDRDPATSDGVFVYIGGSRTLIGGYTPKSGDEIVISARVSEYFDQTQLTGAEWIATLATGVNDVTIDDARPAADAKATASFWEQHEGMQLRVRAGAGVIEGTKNGEIWAIDRDDPLMKRDDPYARRVFRDAHPLDDQFGLRDNGNGNRIMIGSMGVKAATGDSHATLPPARTFDTFASDAIGGLSYASGKYGIQVAGAVFTRGIDPARNHPPQPADRSREVAVATLTIENAAARGRKLDELAGQIIVDLHEPDLLLVQQADDQGQGKSQSEVDGKGKGEGLRNGEGLGNGDGRGKGEGQGAGKGKGTLQDLALTIKAKGGPTYAAASDPSSAGNRDIVEGFLYRTDRLSLAKPSATDPILGTSPQITYRTAGLPANTKVANPKSLNAFLPDDVDKSTGVDGSNVYTRAPQVALFDVKAGPTESEHFPLWAISNHFSSGPDSRVGQRREQATYGAAIVTAIETAHPDTRVIYGGDLNTFPRPDDPVPAQPGDQLGPLYRAGLHNLWEDLVVDTPETAYSSVVEGQAQTLDNLFANETLSKDLTGMASAHLNADWPSDLGDHDPQVARFQSQPALAVGDATVAEGNAGTTQLVFPATLSRPLSEKLTVCAAAIPGTAEPLSDFDPYLACETFAPGATTASFTVRVRGDSVREPDERLALTIAPLCPDLRLVSNTATGLITNDDD
jgi:hypothetical protein